MNKTILVAPLNWGIGHATRCIPIINALIAQGFIPIIASDGEALQLLRKEFSTLKYITLPSYNISYPKKGSLLKYKLLVDSPKILKAIKAEKKKIDTLIDTYEISGIITDNRFGVYSKRVPSVFITHQLQVLSGSTTWLSTKIHQQLIKNFDACWVPDFKGDRNLSGALGHPPLNSMPTIYLGVLSRLNYIECKKEYDLLVLLSGPEPQRTILEKQLLIQLQSYSGKILFVQGKIEDKQKTRVIDQITLVNYMQSAELETAINKSDAILSRSGYSTVLDLAKLKKKAFFIPTPGQFEQEYLAQYLDKKRIAPYCTQDEFSLKKLETINNYNGFLGFESEINFKDLFSLF